MRQISRGTVAKPQFPMPTMIQKIADRTNFPDVVNRVSPSVLYLGCVMLAYIAVSKIAYTRHTDSDWYILAYGVTLAVVAAGIGVGYQDATRAFRILLRSVIAFALFYIVASRVEITETLLQQDTLADFELNAAWIAVLACGLIGFFRPSFGLVPLFFILWQKQQLARVFSIHIDWLDYFTLVETGTFLVLGYLLYVLFRRVAWLEETISFPATGFDGAARNPPIALPLIDVLVLFAVALHFGNYLYAGLIKATLGGNPIFWVLDNPTEYLVLAAWESKALPISFSPALAGFVYEWLADVRVLSNFVTIAVQLFAIVAIIRVRWAIVVTLCYDVLHFIIFFTTGIFFWKFIILNLAIVAALGTMKIPSIPRQLKFALCAAVVCSPFVFHIMPSFAWLDSRSSNRTTITAITEDGSEYAVPSNYFLGLSVTFAQNRLVWPTERAALTGTWGGTRDKHIMDQSMACAWPSGSKDGHGVPFAVPKEQIELLIRRYHQQVLSMLDAQGRFEYDAFPHHIFSMPWYSTEFRNLDKRRIRSYRYVSETLCMDHEGGHPAPRRQLIGSFDIPV